MLKELRRLIAEKMYRCGRVMQVISIFCFSFSLFTFAYGQTVTSTELINNAKLYDGKTVSYSGEVIGDVMVRKEYAWVNINDGKNAIGIWMPKGLADNISYTGSYNANGDYVEISGIFRRSCIEHGGDLDIHASSLTKIRSGSSLHYSLSVKTLNFSFYLSCVILLLCLLRILHLKKFNIK
ncbi:MAG: DNA-binding protein [Candidatus Omnitrophica bacterium]|nr:DNA-binding protein [Candidatus Omnitrophota bacterium]